LALKLGPPAFRDLSSFNWKVLVDVAKWKKNNCPSFRMMTRSIYFLHYDRRRS
jgi:hypothetical protein